MPKYKSALIRNVATAYGLSPTKADEEKGDSKKHGDVPALVFRTDGNWSEHSGDSENQQGVEDVASHHIAYRDVGRTVQGAVDTDHQFGAGCAEADNGEAYDKFTDSEFAGNCRCSVNQDVRAENNKGKAQNQ